MKILESSQSTYQKGEDFSAYLERWAADLEHRARQDPANKFEYILDVDSNCNDIDQ